MLRFLRLAALALLCATPLAFAQKLTQDDPYQWLEDVNGVKAMGWVREQNTRTEKELKADPRYARLQGELRAILDSKDRLPAVERLGDHYYNFWRDEQHPRGIWRRVDVDNLAARSPRWETVFDLDALANHEGQNWVWKGAECHRPEKPNEPYRQCMLALSRGGADAVALREFDLIEHRLIVGPKSFVLAEDKQHVRWKDADTLWVVSPFAEHEKTSSGYARVAREWKRGTLASASPIVLQGLESDVAVDAWSERDAGVRRDWFERTIAYWDNVYEVSVDGKRVRLDIPADAEPITFADWLLIRTRTPWTTGGRTYPGGSLLAARFDLFLRGSRTFDVLFEPGERRSLAAIDKTRTSLLLTELDNVRSRLWEVKYDGQNWQQTPVPVADNAQVRIASTYWASDDYLFTTQDFTTPATLFARSAGKAPVAIKAAPSFFKADGLQTQQFEAVSRDGTRIPYFLVMRKNAPLDGSQPTLLQGYGGFAQSELPYYSGIRGKAWLEPGGAFVLANLRGGGEFGPEWHRSAQGMHKQRTWDDFAAVAEDLIKRKITSPRRLAIMGGSQGGLLVTTTLIQRPELFGAAVAQVPLTDMLRYHKLLAGASWMAEYGDPEKPAERAAIEKYSPYQNVKKGVSYPRLFLTTSTRDDRVHPGHARKLAAKMLEQGHDVLYFENIEGGHNAAANNEQSARMWAQTYTFLWQQIGSK